MERAAKSLRDNGADSAGSVRVQRRGRESGHSCGQSATREEGRAQSPRATGAMRDGGTWGRPRTRDGEVAPLSCVAYFTRHEGVRGMGEYEGRGSTRDDEYEGRGTRDEGGHHHSPAADIAIQQT